MFDTASKVPDKLLGAGREAAVEVISNGDCYSHAVSDSALSGTERSLGAGGGAEVISNCLSWPHPVSDSALKESESLLDTGGGVEVISNCESWPHPVSDNALKDFNKLLGTGPLDGGVDIISNGDTRLHAVSESFLKGSKRLGAGLAGGGVGVSCIGDPLLRVMPDGDLRKTEEPVRTCLVGSGILDIGQTIPDPMSRAVLIDDDVAQTCKKGSNNCLEIMRDIDRLLKTSAEFAMIRAGSVGADVPLDVMSMCATGNRAGKVVLPQDCNDLFALATLMQCAAHKTLQTACICHDSIARSERCNMPSHMVHAV